MCTRYSFIPEQIRRKPLPPNIVLPEDAKPRYNIAPQQFAYVVRWVDGDPRSEKMQWGYAPRWVDPSRAQVNLRAEVVFGTLMFDEAAKHSRCIALLSGWYEWPDRGQGTDPRYYHRSGGGLLGVAALWTRNYSTRLDTFAIIGTAINPTSTYIHNRTPVVLREELYGLWLNPAVAGEAHLSEALRFYEPPDLAYHRVGPYIDDAACDSEKCIERVD
ncbi:MAG TPA: SOS response-associated peptidase [Gammaproteobacteria bacterium]|jgi:putative SOS response-associated peptidase YedK